MKLYLVEMKSADGSEIFWKVGFTRHERVLDRFYRHGKVPLSQSSLEKLQQIAYRMLGYTHEPDFPYLVDVLHEVRLNRDVDPEIIEGELLGALTRARHLPKQYFSGQSECFIIDEEGRKLIAEYMNIRAAELNQPTLSPTQGAAP